MISSTMKLSTLFIFIIIQCQLTYSQVPLRKSFIITYESDTIHGYGDMNLSQEYCVFKANGSDKRERYFPRDIAAFRYEGSDFFVSRQIPDSLGKPDYRFLELLVDGEVDLYALGNSARFFMGMEGKELLELNDDINSVEVINGRIYGVQDNKYLGYIRYYLMDAPQLFPKIDKMDRLNEKDLVNIAIEYHNIVCQDYDCVNYTKPVKPPKSTRAKKK